MSFLTDLSGLGAALGNLATTNPALANNIMGGFSTKGKAATKVMTILHALTMSVGMNPAGQGAAVQGAVSAIDTIDGVEQLNITDQVLGLMTAKDLTAQIGVIENAVAASLPSKGLFG